MAKLLISGQLFSDRRVLLVLILSGLVIAARTWITAHPGHNPWAPLNLDDRAGWATPMKLSALRNNVSECRAVLQRSDVAFSVLPRTGEGACLRADRTRLDSYTLSPSAPSMTCPSAVAMELWRRETLDPAAREIFGSEIDTIEHLGVYSCRRIYGGDTGVYSEHATGNAIDIAGFRLADGTRISVLHDWDDGTSKSLFLREVRSGACRVFSTVLSPDYNSAHADHFHFDQANGWRGACR